MAAPVAAGMVLRPAIPVDKSTGQDRPRLLDFGMEAVAPAAGSKFHMAAADFMSILQKTGGISAIASQLGIPASVAEAGAAALLRAVVGGLSKQANAAGGGDGGMAGKLVR